jgi:3,4-dihydroxy 2-butanone 4-phosphate synthase/GTP cyclohydrolase II
MPSRFSSVEAAIAAIARGETVIVADDEDRENEGDFVCAADASTPEVINFMIREGRGQVCMSILPDVAKRLDLPMMVATNSAPLGTAFTVPVDHRSAKTGITAAERAISFRSSPRRAESSAAPATPRRQSISLGWRVGRPPG